MSFQDPPLQVLLLLLQRCHWYTYVKEELPVQVPLVVVSVWPSVVVPETTGATVFVGVMLAMAAVAALFVLVLLAGGVVPVAVTTEPTG